MTFSDEDTGQEKAMTDEKDTDRGLRTASEMQAALAAGAMSARELTEGAIANIKSADGGIHAFSHIDEEGALQWADALDAYRITGNPLGPLHGIPIALKDIIDVKGMPCARGSKVFEGRVPDEDARLVSLLREAGAIIIGKTVTTEMAYFAPGPTRNPHNPDHTPGGSSSGSAASVAAGMVPLSLGSQTNGSMIRPASFCGVYGYKPSFARISRAGVLRTSGHLDTVGMFARTLEDLALLGDVLLSYDGCDPEMVPLPKPQLMNSMAEELIAAPRLAFMRTPYWEHADESTKDAFRELILELTGSVDIVDLPPIFEKVHAAHGKIMAADFARELGDLYESHKNQLSFQLQEIIERGKKVTDTELKEAFELQKACSELLETYFDDYDGILTPSACGEAPKGLQSTGDPGFSTIWQFTGMPCLSLPLFDGPNGLPLGAQLVGQKNRDGRLFCLARHFMKELDS